MDDYFDDGEFGIWDGKCQACDLWTRVDDVGLCVDCSAKLDRDMIRQRNWDYSAAAFGVPTDRREELRAEVIRQYGERLELISADGPVEAEGKGRSRRKPTGKRRA